MAKQFIKQKQTRKQILPSREQDQDQKTDITKLWRTIKGIDGKTIHQAENKTRKQILPSCGEQLRELMAKQFIKQRTRPENRYYQAVENN